MIQKPKRLAFILGLNYQALLNLVKNVNIYYREKKKPKTDCNGMPILKNGKKQYRIMYPSNGLLKQTQKMIKCKILRKLSYPIFIQGGIEKRSNISNAKLHQGKKFHFCTDIKQFFPSINNKMVYSMFVDLGFSPDVSRILTILTTYKGELPQGTPTSSHIANLVFQRIDNLILGVCKENGITYTRFIDDLSLSSSKDFKSVSLQLLEQVRQNGFKLNNGKTFYKVGPTLVTGVWVRNNNLDARVDQKNKLIDKNLDKSQIRGLYNYIQNVKKA